jgi:predicted CXXCH cytochrome family protein
MERMTQEAMRTAFSVGRSAKDRIARWLCALCVASILCAPSLAQTGGDVIGEHDLSPGSSSPLQGTLSGSCIYCHAPHSGLGGINQSALWDQKLSKVTNYTPYTSSTMVNTTMQPLLGADSSLCLSCHDGTVAPGQLVPYGQITMSGTPMQAPDNLGTNLQSDHPFSFVLPLKAGSDLQPSLSATPPMTADTTGHVKLIKGNVECTSCHNPHVQNIDPSSKFLVIDNSNGALCLACHTTNPSGTGMGLVASTVSTMAATPVAKRTVTHRANPLQEWQSSIHATASNSVAVSALQDSSHRQNRMTRQASSYSYPSVAKNGCLSCHQSHNVLSPTSLLRGVDDQACVACHSGTKNISPAAPNVFAEMASPKISHSFPSSGTNSHQAHEDALLDHNRHATCVDCHNPHSSGRVATFAPAPTLRISQGRVTGISATDGTTVLTPAVNQYENCLRCHGTSTGKQTSTVLGYMPTRAASAVDPLNLIPQFALTSTSSHPVTHDRSSALPQPSLLPNMLQLDGTTKGRSMGVRILCTDCHNSDDNREFGGTGANGPHGSTFSHILERRYEFSRAPIPGKLVTNLFPTPTLSAAGGGNGGPYALCAKCHDLKQIVANTSFSEHARHINDGFSCSVCHTAHGMGVNSGIVSGERLVNFDVNVVAPNGSTPISYSRARNSCSLMCHGHAHQLVNGTAGNSIKQPK